MSQEQQNDPLHDFQPDLSKTTVARPCLSNGTYLFELTAVTGKFGKIDRNDPESGDDHAKPMRVLTWELRSEGMSVPVNGVPSKPIEPGYTIEDFALLYQPEQKPGKKAFDFQPALARRYDALAGTDDTNRPDNYADYKPFIGKKACLTIKATEDPQFGWRPNIQSYKPAPAGV